MRLLIAICFLSTTHGISQNEWMSTYDFVYLDEYLDHAHYEVRYHGTHNFVGDTITGYLSDRVVMTKAAAVALQKIEASLWNEGYCLKIFDTYRPQRAVDHFKNWSQDHSDTLTKKEFYPKQIKAQLFNLGYISSRSGHSRGSTIDLTLANKESGTEIDMGSPYDFFGSISHHTSTAVTQEQHSNRLLLKTAMNRYGFRSYSKEWWHYTLNGEPYKDRYFDFVVTPDK